MIEVIVTVNSRTVRKVQVFNRGPVGGVYEPGDSQGGLGRRVYEWQTLADHGFVEHRRADPLEHLVGKVLADVVEQVKLYPADPTEEAP